MIKWYDISEAREKFRAFNFIIGGRGIGKTYSAIDYIINQNEPFLYMRNTDVQLQESATSFGNPFKRWNSDHGRNVILSCEKKHYIIREDEKLLGYGAALSTFANLRGVDLSEVKTVLFDEFCERRPLAFKQFDAFANFYETVNRNRELLGEEPLKVLLLSNAQKLDNPILAGYGIIPVIEKMLAAGKRETVAPHYYIALPESEISEAKRVTANYALTKESYFNKEALDNKFAYDSFLGVGKKPLKEYLPVCAVDGIYIYRHKNTGRYYACQSQAVNVRAFSTKDSKGLFMRVYGATFIEAEARNLFDFSDYYTKSRLCEILGA